MPASSSSALVRAAWRQPTETYNGYTSCPMITQVGRAMLAEFDYNNKLSPSFPGIIAPLEELWISWLTKEDRFHSDLSNKAFGWGRSFVPNSDPGNVVA